MSAIDRDVAFLLGLPFNVMTMEQAVVDAVAQVQSRQPGYFITPNSDFVAKAYNNEALKEVLFHADRILCDGMPLVWLSRYFKPALPERVAGSDLVLRLFEQADRRNWSVFFLGADEACLAKVNVILSEKYPGMQVSGGYAPPYGPIQDWPNEAIAERIRAAQPDLLLVAVGCPKQEYWISRYYKELAVPLSIGIGASLDFISGAQTRAPRWMQKVGLEWLWRLLGNPRRLLKRYSSDFYYLLLLSYRQQQSLRRRKRGFLRGQLAAAQADPAEGFLSPVEAPPPPPQVHWLSWEGSAELGQLEALSLPADYSVPVFIDLSQVSFIDSSGLGLLVKVARQARQAKVAFGLLSPSPVVQRVLRTMRLDGQLLSYMSREAALVAAQGISDPQSQLPAAEAELRVELSSPFGRKGESGCSEILSEAAQAVRAGQTLVVDLAAVEVIDSYAISRLLNAYQLARSAGGYFRVEGYSDQVEQTMRLTRVYHILTDFGAHE